MYFLSQYVKITFDRIFSPFQINTQLLFVLIFFTKWLPTAILEDRKSLSIAFLAISDQYATFICFDFFHKMAANSILEDRKSLSIAFLALSDQYANFIFFFFFHKMAAGGHFGWKSLSIAFRTISDKYATFIFFWFFFTKWLPAPSLDYRKSL